MRNDLNDQSQRCRGDLSGYRFVKKRRVDWPGPPLSTPSTAPTFTAISSCLAHIVSQRRNPCSQAIFRALAGLPVLDLVLTGTFIAGSCEDIL